MKNVNTPGFTAQASLGKTAVRYRSTLHRATGDAAQVVLPQNWLGDLLGDIGDFLGGVERATMDGLRCSASTLKVGVACTAGVAEGDVGGCTDAISEWGENCIND